MKSCGHSEQGEAVEGFLAGTLHDLIHALQKDHSGCPVGLRRLEEGRALGKGSSNQGLVMARKSLVHPSVL